MDIFILLVGFGVGVFVGIVTERLILSQNRKNK